MRGCGCSENLSCNCCEGVEIVTPQPTANRPGLNALQYRVGTHAAFFETMRARLSTSYLEIPGFDAQGKPLPPTKTYPLHNLNTRAADDMSIALLDASATMLDVLTFYQERIANEGYLRTATERRSVLELGRLVGYTPRPGVASSVYLAYTLDDKSEPVEIPEGARAQSIPAQDELPQSFETSEKLEARKEWNDLKPRRTRPQNLTPNSFTLYFGNTLYFEGTETNLKPNDPLLFVFKDTPLSFRKVRTVEPLFEEKKTKVTLQFFFDRTVFKSAVQQVVQQVIGRHGKFKLFCIDAKDKLAPDISALLAFLDEVTDKDDLPEVFQKADDLKTKAGESGNIRVQKWASELSADLLENLRAAQVDFQEIRTVGSNGTTLSAVARPKAFDSLVNLAKPLSLPASLQPANSLHLKRDARQVFDTRKDTIPQILTSFNPRLGETAYQAWANTTVTEPSPVKVYALRVTASLFGSASPGRILGIKRETGEILKTGEYPIVELVDKDLQDGKKKIPVKNHEEEDIIDLDSTYDKIVGDTWVVVDKSALDKEKFVSFEAPPDLLITRALKVSTPVTRFDYGISPKTTRLELKNSWIKFIEGEKEIDDSQAIYDEEFKLIRKTVVYAQSEELELAQEPINYDVCGGEAELGALYDGLQPGRWVIVSGERADIPGTSGIKASELVMLAAIEQGYDENLPGDKIHTTLLFANKLAYVYKRDTVKIYGNVVKATHGETRGEVLGSGDASVPMQAFTLKQPPLTYVSAPTPSGIESTLHVRVNEVEWDETDTLAELKPPDRNFVTKTDDEAKTTVIFGNGKQGARLPTGVENVKAIYRSGIGKGGNVKAEQISLLMTKPLGVKEVINPLRASGGADKETRDQARRNVPVALMALDRLVSTKDYADYARTFAGIGKAVAARLTDGRRQIVHLTIAGAEDIPIDVNSDLYKNLRRALSQYGDPHRAVKVETGELMALVIGAKVRVLPQYQWETVEPKIRAALLDEFSFERRELGQNVFLSEVIGTIQQIAGVAYVDVDVLDSLSESEILDSSVLDKKLKQASGENDAAGNQAAQPKKYIPVALAQNAAQAPERARLIPGKSVLPAQLAILLPDAPATLNLNLIEKEGV
jgi:hypothetical protein